VVTNVTVTGCQTGVMLYTAGNYGYVSPRLSWLTLAHNIRTGLFVGGPDDGSLPHSDVQVTDSVVHDTSGDPAYTDNHSGDGIIISNTDGGLITRCAAYGNGFLNAHTGGGPVGLWAYDANNVTISHSASWANRNGFGPGEQEDGGGFDLDGGCTNSVMEYNLAWQNAGPGFLVCQYAGSPRPTANNTVRYSVSVGDGQIAANMAAGLQWYTPDSLADTTVVGMTVFAAATPAGTPAAIHVQAHGECHVGDVVLAHSRPISPLPLRRVGHPHHEQRVGGG
jgi:hypothetical protein